MSQFNETEDDLPLRSRRSMADERINERSSAEVERPLPSDREVTLNTGTVLALFFTLALICAVFFGFGYSMGRKSTQAATSAEASTSTSSTSSSDTAATSAPSSFKPAPGSPAIQAVPGYMSQAEANAANEKAATQTYKAVAPASTAAVVTPTAVVIAKKPATLEPVAEAAPKPAPVVRATPAAVPGTAPVVTYNSAAPPATPGVTYVQIAAVSHQEDADVLLSALKRRGYKVLARTDVNDHLIHVQIGPFDSRKDAEGTRQKLLSDGYNAFLK